MVASGWTECSPEQHRKDCAELGRQVCRIYVEVTGRSDRQSRPDRSAEELRVDPALSARRARPAQE